MDYFHIDPIAPPPVAYDHVYDGHLEIRVGTLDQVEQACHTAYGIVTSNRALGCMTGVGGNGAMPVCFIVIPKIEGPVTATIQMQIRRHEIAHCNGWPAEHPR